MNTQDHKEESHALTLLIIAFLLGVIACSCNTPKRYVEVRSTEQQYQIQLTNDSIYLLDGKSLIKVMPLNDSTELGRVLLEDNQ